MQNKDEPNRTLIRALLSGDELSMVVRSHIKVEEQVDHFLVLHVVSYKHLEKISLTFAEKCLLAVALGMDEDLIKPLSTLGNIRNKFAHKTDSELTKSDVNNFYKAFSATGKEVLQETIATNSDRPEQLARKYNDMSIREKFALMTIYLHSNIRGLVHDEVERMNALNNEGSL
ncbi:hypothetical protein [Marinobacter flavimaris]|nr:hypothetical protein [Marinobacter flavimaris]